MGARQARCVLAAGFALTAWNRSVAKAEALLEHGAVLALTPADAVKAADIVVLMLENGDIVREVLFDSGAAQAMKPGTLVIDMSSIKPAQAREHAAQLAALGLQHLDAPVSGGISAAEAGTLAIMVGGEASAFAQAAPLFAAMGRATHVGPSGAGQLAKLANQLIVAINIAGVCEALQLAASGGADPAKVRKRFAAALPKAGCWTYTANAWWRATSPPTPAPPCSSRIWTTPWKWRARTVLTPPWPARCASCSPTWWRGSARPTTAACGCSSNTSTVKNPARKEHPHDRTQKITQPRLV